MKCLPRSAIFSFLLLTASAFATPPNTPTIIEPATDGQVVSPSDVHMATGPFSDPDGDTLACADWDITEVSSTTIVWVATCATDFSAFHIHLGDGTFTNSYVGRTTLLYDTDYSLHVRQKDSAGSYSTNATRLFHTGSAVQIFPLHTTDIASSPAPVWLDSPDANVILPAGSPQPSLRLESAAGELLLQFSGANGVTNVVNNPIMLTEHVAVRVKIDAGDTGGALVLPDSTIAFTGPDGASHTIYLPTLDVPQGQQVYLWVSVNGSTYYGTGAQTTPDFSNLARGAPVPWQVNQLGYKVEIVATGFQLPVNIAFVPNPGTSSNSPAYYVTELHGNVKVVTRDGTVVTYASNLLNFNPTGAFPGSGEQGVTGILVEPTTGDVLVSLMYSSVPGQESAPHYPKVVRFHSNDGGLTAATQTNVLDMVGELVSPSHQQSNLSIGPDGKLYLHMGDGFEVATGQNTNTFRGKILRFNFDGTPANDNPFFNAANGTNATDYIFSYGFRNPFGGAWRASDGFHYMVENGPTVDRIAKIVAGRNYGWDGNDTSMTNFAIYNWSPAHAPVNIAFIQSSTFDGSAFPTNKYDHAYVTESGPTYGAGPQSLGKRISEFVLDSAGSLLSGPTPLIEYTGSGQATAAGLAAGPDGLYFTDLYKDWDATSPIDAGANVLRIKFVGAADFKADITSATAAPLTVHFTDLSNVPSPSNWLWDFGDGVTSVLQNPMHTYATQGLYDVRLSVTGPAGLQITQKTGFIGIGGVGLQGQYFDNVDLTNLKITRTDATVNFDWVNDSPDLSIGPQTFSVRWSGKVKPQFSQTYTFYTTTDDGVRLYVNGQLLIDKWVDQSSTQWSNTIALTAGQLYDIKMEYYENTVEAMAKLSWFSPSQPYQIIPQSALYRLMGNQAPVVSVGTNQTIALPSTAALTGTIADDGLPQPPGVVTATWSKVSGPGTVTFGNIHATNTTASFSTNGTYLLRLTANDSVLSAGADTTVTVRTAFEQWQMQYFGCTNCAQAAADADPDGDGFTNLQESLAGTDPTKSSSALRITSLFAEGNNMLVSWTAVSNKSYSVQVATNFADGFTNAFTDLATVVVPLNVSITETNYLALGGATNAPALYYRIRLAP